MMMSEDDRAGYRHMQDLARNSPNDSQRRMARLWIQDFHLFERLASEQTVLLPAVGTSIMSLEESIVKLAAALDANTAALKAAGTAAPAAAATKPAATKPAAAPAAAKPKHSREELAAAAGAYKEKTDATQAKALIAEHGKAEKLKDVADANLDALYDAFVSATAALDAAGSDDI